MCMYIDRIFLSCLVSLYFGLSFGLSILSTHNTTHTRKTVIAKLSLPSGVVHEKLYSFSTLSNTFTKFPKPNSQTKLSSSSFLPPPPPSHLLPLSSDFLLGSS